MKRRKRVTHRKARRGRGAPVEEIDGEGRSSGGFLGVAVLHERGGEVEWCMEERCSGVTFIGLGGGEEGAPEAVGGGTPATIKAR
jgi:hypothetical protein